MGKSEAEGDSLELSELAWGLWPYSWSFGWDWINMEYTPIP